jgi:RimJ/RimL family protein N-acetyltransferase
MQPPEIFETPRLVARPPRVADAPAAFECYASDPAVTRYLAWKAHAEVSTVAEFFGAAAAHWRTSSGLEGHYPWLLFRHETDELVGSISVDIEDHAVLFGYVLGRAHWGQGLATEALRTLIAWALGEPRVYRAWAVCDVDNPASARVMEKVGMRREGILRRWHVCPTLGEEPRDCFVYSRVR